jgi:hypothetical protein
LADIISRVVLFAAPTTAAGSTIDVTIPGAFGGGFPKAATFHHGETTLAEAATTAPHARVGLGITDGTNQRAVAYSSRDGVGTTSSGRADSAAAVVIMYPVFQANEASRLEFDSWIADGVRLRVGTAFAVDNLIECTLIGGADVVNAAVGTIALGTGTAAIPVSLAFQPSEIKFSSIGMGASVSPGFGICSVGRWINDGADTQRALCWQDQSGVVTSNTSTYIGGSYVAGQLNNNGSISWLVSCSSPLATGFSITPSSSTGGDLAFYLALEYSGAYTLELKDVTIPTAGNLVIPTASTATYVEAVFSGHATARGTLQNATDISFSAMYSDASNSYSQAFVATDNVTSTEVHSVSREGLSVISSYGGAQRATGGAPTFSATEVTSVISLSPPADILGWALVLGDGGGAVTTPVNFTGTIADSSTNKGDAVAVDVSGSMAGTEGPFSYSSVGTVLPSGWTIDAATGVLTPVNTVAVTVSGIVIRATDTDADTADTNAFTITITDLLTTVFEPNDFDSAQGTGSVAAENSSTPAVTLIPHITGDLGSTFINYYGRISGLLNKTPTFSLDFTDWRAGTASTPNDTDWEMQWRYIDDTDPGTGRVRASSGFDNNDAASTPHGFSNNAAFTEDSVEIVIKPRWRYIDTIYAVDYSVAQAGGYAFELPSSVAGSGVPAHFHDSYLLTTSSENTAAKIPLNMLGIGFKDDAQSPPGGAEKLQIVMIAGQHASEDQGSMMAWEYAFYFMEGVGTVADWFRQNCVLRIYDANPSGRYYGNVRTTEENEDFDPNRVWNGVSGSSVQIEATKAAIALDGAPDVFVDNHGAYSLNGNGSSQSFGMYTNGAHQAKTSAYNRMLSQRSNDFRSFGSIPVGSAESYYDVEVPSQLSITAEGPMAADGFPDQSAMFSAVTLDYITIFKAMLEAGELTLAGAETAVASDLAATYGISELVFADLGAIFNVGEIAGNESQLLFKVSETVGASRAFFWNILESGIVGNDLQTLFNISELVHRDAGIAWKISEIVSSEGVIRWDILESVAKDATILYKMLADNVVFSELGFTWNTSELAGAQLYARWRVIGELAGRVLSQNSGTRLIYLKQENKIISIDNNTITGA